MAVITEGVCAGVCECIKSLWSSLETRKREREGKRGKAPHDVDRTMAPGHRSSRATPASVMDSVLTPFIPGRDHPSIEDVNGQV